METTILTPGLEEKVGFPQEDKSNDGAFPIGSIVQLFLNNSMVAIWVQKEEIVGVVSWTWD